MIISIHSPLAGRDFYAKQTKAGQAVFQSTRPSRGETCYNIIVPRGTGISIHSPLAGRDRFQQIVQIHIDISIHSPLAGRDAHGATVSAGASYFNPLAPRGARPGLKERPDLIKKFQSTRPSRGETPCKPETHRLKHISIHSPLAGRDSKKS